MIVPNKDLTHLSIYFSTPYIGTKIETFIFLTSIANIVVYNYFLILFFIKSTIPILSSRYLME